MGLDSFDSRPFVARRARLAARLGAQPALIASGRARPRTYAANAYPFRAASHFLYLFGLPLQEAFGLWDGQGWILFVPKPDPSDALWTGPQPEFLELARALGCAVRGMSDLEVALDRFAALGVATLPAIDRESCDQQARLCKRDVWPGRLGTENDLVLADAMIAMRLVHDDAAVAELRAAATATAAAHAAGMRATRPGLRESHVRAAMEQTLMARGVGTSYGSIVTVHGEILHNESHGNEMKSGDLLLADVGAETEGGWAGDVTRTWPVNGTYSTTQAELYDVVLAAQQATIAAVRPGVRYRDLHLLAARRLCDGLLSLGILRGDPDELVADGVVYLLFPHGIGHLIGLDVHDMEDLGDRAGYAPGRTRSTQFGMRYLRLDRDLVPGMAVTIEPGIYLVPAILEDEALQKMAGDRLNRTRLAAFSDVRGIRIEDDVLVTDSGSEVLTAKIPKQRSEVQSAMT